MANDRSVGALLQVLHNAPGLPAGLALEALAGHLADAGVLFPGALKDDEAVKIGVDAAGTMPSDRSEIGLCVREGLEKIARGTP